jgi:hypothetical protein
MAFGSHVGCIEHKRNPTPTIQIVHGILGFVSRITYRTCLNPTRLFPKRCSLSDYKFLRVYSTARLKTRPPRDPFTNKKGKTSYNEVLPLI